MKSASQYILDSSREYSIYVCENRAIPKVTDGLKDGQRKALWLIKGKSEKTKTISLAGEMIQTGLFHHGDVSAADAISKLAAPYLNNAPLLRGIGTFGTRVAPVAGIGAPRYTYVKKSAVAQKALFQDLDIIPMKENFDGSGYEPMTFLPIIPIVLMNGVEGIAVGWKTTILPRKPDAIINAVLKTLEGKKFNRLPPHYSYLDIGVSHLEDNSWEFVGKVIKQNATTVAVTELPPDLTLEKFRDRLDKMEDDGKIASYDDNSTKVINVEIKFKRGMLTKMSNEKLIQYFKLRQKKTEKIVVVDWNFTSIREYESAEQLIIDFVDWRFGEYVNRYKKLLSDSELDLKFLLGVNECFVQKFPETLMKAKTKSDVEKSVSKITTQFGLDQKQIDKIVSFPSFKWAKDAHADVKAKIKELQTDIKGYKDYLNNPSKIKDVFHTEVSALKGKL